MIKGKVKKFDYSKGWGFIEDDDGYDYFFNISHVRKGQTVRKGSRVKFDVIETAKGSEAQNITIF